MNSPNKSATISVADFLFLPFFQTPLIPNSRNEVIKNTKSYKGLYIPDIKDTDKIVITPVSCLDGPQDSLIIKKDEYPQFDNLLSKLIIDEDSYCTSYTIIKLYKGTKLIIRGYLYDVSKIKEMWEAINQAKEWFKKKQKL